MPLPREPVYAKDEKALCFHHEFLYEAKVLESRNSDPTDKKSPLQYRVHYKGWKSTWDDWVPQDRLRKLTEENKQLATNLKREIDEMNPRAAGKSAKPTKKKTAGSDLSSARGSEERQSLPPGRGQKRGHDNEIEKVRSSISLNSSPSTISYRSATLSQNAMEPMDLQEASSSPPMQRPRITLRLPSQQTQLPSSTEHMPKQQSKKQTDNPVAKNEIMKTSDEVSTNPVPAQVNATGGDLDLQFWLEEAASLNLDFSYGHVKFSLARPKVRANPITIPRVNKKLSKRRVRSEDYVPLHRISDSALASRVSKMLRNKAQSIGDGLDPPWPNERSKGPKRHPKWTHTLHVDLHNHSKLAFYAEIAPTDNPVIAGFQPEHPPTDFIPKPAAISPIIKKQKVKNTAKKNSSYLVEQHATRGRQQKGHSSSDDSTLENLVQESNELDKKMTQTEDQILIDSSKEPSHPMEEVGQAKDITQGFHSLGQHLSVEDSGEETNSELEQEEHFHARPAVKIEVPDHLKAILVDDWENVTKNLSLVPIPADHPVSEILSTYFEEEKGKRRLGSAEADLLEEVVHGTKDYFEQCLGKLLLYRFEREQYFRLHQAMEKGKEEFEGRPLKDKKIADIYGAEHLCRLFVSLPELIAQTNMDAQSVSKLRQEIQALTAWLGKNSTRFFTAEYEVAPQEYVEKARGL